MSFVNITALTFPPGAEEEIEDRFARRNRAVEKAAGFEGFELLRPVFGESRYFVVTRWDSQESYQKWALQRQSGGHEEDKARGMSVEVFGFDVVLDH